jgi:uncharacterized membrane protein
MAATIAKHPIHPMLVPFPIGLWVFSLVADVVFLAGWGPPVWNDVAFYTMVAGTIAALLAAPFGLLDFLSIRDPRTRQLGATHLALNLVILAMFAADIWLRTQTGTSAGLPVVISLVAVSLLVVSGWLGGEMVFVHGAGVMPPEERREMEIRTEVRRREKSA